MDTLLCVYLYLPLAEPGLERVYVLLKVGGGNNNIWIFGKDRFVISKGG
jgi:hypothetical protein